MAEFSIQDAAFTGFRVVREHPRALAVWAAYALVMGLALQPVFMEFSGPDMLRLQDAAAHPPADPALVASLFGRLAPAYAAFTAISLVANAILGAAMIRSILRPAEDAVGFLRLGGQEIRQLGLGLLTLIVYFAVSLVLALGLSLVLGILAAATRMAPAAGAMLMILGVAVAFLFVAVRLSLAPALTFDSGRINLFGSWTLTRGRFWPLFGTYLLTTGLAMVVYGLSFLVILALGAVVNGGDMLAPPRPAAETLQSFLTPWRLIETVLTAGVSALVWPVMLTPAPAIYRLLAGTGGDAAARAFL